MKKYRKGQRPIIMSQQEFKKYQENFVKQNLVLSAAYLMDVEGYDEDQIVDYWESITRWVDAIDKHVITLRTVQDIIEKTRGLKC